MDERLKNIPVRHREILWLLKSGIDNAITSRELMRLTGIKADSEIRELIHDLVERYHIPIGASNSSTRPGYYLIANESEREAARHNLTGRLGSMGRRLKVISSSDFFFNNGKFVPINPEQIKLF